MDLLLDLAVVLRPAFKADHLDAHRRGQARVQPALKELGQRFLLGVTLDEEHDLHAIPSSSPERNSAPRLYSSSHRRSSSPSMMESWVSPFTHCTIVVRG